jgi:hypothetical protein
VGSPRDESVHLDGPAVEPRRLGYRAAAQLVGEVQRTAQGHPLPPVLGWQAFNLATLGEFEEAVAHGTEAVALAETPGFVARTQSLLVLLWASARRT